MCAAATEGSRLNVGRFTAVYCVPSRHPAPERLRQRLDEALEKEFAGALVACAARLFSEADESVWLIRRLDISVDLDVGSGRDRLASAWAAQFARTLTRELRADAGADNCIRFPNRAAYLASFLGDLSRSSAWDKWYYSVFEGLRVLPQSAALRTAACDRPAEGLAALTSLTRHALEQFVRCLTRQDARRILQSLTEGGGDGTDEGACLEALRAAWGESERGASPGEDEEHATLRLCVRACSDAKAAACASLGRVARALVRLARLLGDASPERARRLTEVLAARDLARLHVETLADAETLSPLLRCEPRLLREVCDELRARASGGASSRTAGDGGARHTHFGGALMLLPALGALPLEEATAGWPRLGRTEPPSLARLLLLAQCCGATRALRLFYDPTARDLLGVPPDITAEEVNAWQRGVTHANVEQFLGVICAWRASRGLLGRLDGLGSLALLRVRIGGRRVALLLDPARGVWLRACAFDRRRADAVLRQLRSCLARVLPETEHAGLETAAAGRTREKAPREGLNGREGLGKREEFIERKEACEREEVCEQEREVLFCDEAFDAAFVEGLRESFLCFRVVVLSGALAGELAREDPTLAEFMTRRAHAGADLLYLSPPRAFGLSAHLRLALSVVAQGLLRDFARRLPGFAQSGLEYLYANFLDCEAVYEEEASRRVARLGRPPLAVVLSMTGAASGAHRLAWLDARPLAFFQE